MSRSTLVLAALLVACSSSAERDSASDSDQDANDIIDTGASDTASLDTSVGESGADDTDDGPTDTDDTSTLDTDPTPGLSGTIQYQWVVDGTVACDTLIELTGEPILGDPIEDCTMCDWAYTTHAKIVDEAGAGCTWFPWESTFFVRHPDFAEGSHLRFGHAPSWYEYGTTWGYTDAYLQMLLDPAGSPLSTWTAVDYLGVPDDEDAPVSLVNFDLDGDHLTWSQDRAWTVFDEPTLTPACDVGPDTTPLATPPVGSTVIHEDLHCTGGMLNMELDTFAFEATAGSEVSLFFDRDDLATTLALDRFELSGPSDCQIAMIYAETSCSAPDSSGLCVGYTFTAPETGTYTIDVAGTCPVDATVGEYDLYVYRRDGVTTADSGFHLVDDDAPRYTASFQTVNVIGEATLNR